MNSLPISSPAGCPSHPLQFTSPDLPRPDLPTSSGPAFQAVRSRAEELSFHLDDALNDAEFRTELTDNPAVFIVVLTRQGAVVLRDQQDWASAEQHACRAEANPASCAVYGWQDGTLRRLNPRTAPKFARDILPPQYLLSGGGGQYEITALPGDRVRVPPEEDEHLAVLAMAANDAPDWDARPYHALQTALHQLYQALHATRLSRSLP